MKYQEKKRSIEAEKFNGVDLPTGALRAPGENQPVYVDTGGLKIIVNVGDYVVRRDGDVYTCKPENFEPYYEPLEDGE